MSGKLASYISIIRSAVRGDEYDYTTINLRKAVVLLAIPMMLELALESVFAVVDIFFVNKLGTDAVTVVGLTESVLTIVYSVGIGLSAAATAMVARRVGEKDIDGASKAGAQSIILAVITSLLLGIPGFIFAGDILCNEFGNKYIAPYVDNNKMLFDPGNKWSWNPPKFTNPPKSKTVMVELTREDAEYWLSHDPLPRFGSTNRCNEVSFTFYNTVKKALEQ